MSDTILHTSNIREPSLYYSQKSFLTLKVEALKMASPERNTIMFTSHITYRIGWIPRILQKKYWRHNMQFESSLVSKWLAELAVLDCCA